MSQRLTVKTIRDDLRIAPVLNVCGDDPRIPAWLSHFQEKALNMGRWWGSTQLTRFCISEKCLILPREIAVIEQANLNGSPLNMGNQWYQFLRPHSSCSDASSGSSAIPCSGYTRCRCGCGCSDQVLEDNGTVVSFATTTGVNKKIRVYPGNAADAGKKIIFQGRDANGVWVRTTIDGVRADGEEVTLAMPFVDTVTVWGPGAPMGVIKEETAYRVLVYSVVPADSTEVHLATYQPTETLPMYRRVYMPNYRNVNCGGCSTGSLVAIVSLQHIPVKYDNDWLLFQNLTAYKMGMMAEKMYEEGDYAKGNAYFYGTPLPSKNARGVLRVNDGMGALPLLRAELRKQTGDRTTANIQYSSVDLGGFV